MHARLGGHRVHQFPGFAARLPHLTAIRFASADHLHDQRLVRPCEGTVTCSLAATSMGQRQKVPPTPAARVPFCSSLPLSAFNTGRRPRGAQARLLACVLSHPCEPAPGLRAAAIGLPRSAWAVPVAPLTALLAMDCSVQPPTSFYWPRGPAGAGAAPVSRRPRPPDLSLEGALPQPRSRLQFAVCKASGNAHSTFVGVRCNAASSGLRCSASYWGVWSRLGACLALSWQACCRRQPPPAGCYGGRYGSAANRAVQRATARRARCRTPAAVQHQPEMRHRHPSTQLWRPVGTR